MEIAKTKQIKEIKNFIVIIRHTELTYTTSKC